MRSVISEWNWDEVATKPSSVVARNASTGIYEALAIEARTVFLQFAVPQMAPGAILEVGCGTGQWLSLLKARAMNTFGGDRSLPMLRHARDVTSVAQFDAAHLPFADQSFENVLTVTVLQHLPAPLPAMAELARVARDRIVIHEMTTSPIPQRLTPGTSARSESWYRRVFSTYGWTLRAAHHTPSPSLWTPLRTITREQSPLLSLARSVGLLLAKHTWLVFEPTP